MSAPSANAVRFRVEPRDIAPDKAARLLGLTHAAFRDALPRLALRGFPAADPDTGNYDRKAIEAWMDLRSGLAIAPEAQDAGLNFGARLGALRGRGRQR